MQLGGNAEMVLQTVLAVASHLFSCDQPAYLDPGSGSYLIQLLIGGLVGLLFLLKAYWGRIVSFIKGLASPPGDEDGDD
jgi:hypothetical protein